MPRPLVFALALLASMMAFAPARADLSAGDHGTWFELPPPIRSGHSAVVDSLHNRMFVFGGGGGDVVLDLDGSGAWYPLVSTGAGPVTTEGANAVLDRVHGRILLMGGAGAPGVWALSLDGVPRWTLLTSTSTPAASQPLVYDEVLDRLVAYDGMWSWRDDPELAGLLRWLPLQPPMTWRVRPIFKGRGPANRQGAAVAYDSRRHRLVVFGGLTTEQISGADIWSVSLDDDTTWTEHAPFAWTEWHAGRSDASMVYDAVGDRVLIAGGQDDSYAPPLECTDLLQFSFASDTSVGRLNWGGGGFPGAWLGSLVLDTRARRVLFHGGRGLFDPSGSTWAAALEGPADWVPFAPAGIPPTPRTRMDAVFDELTGRLITFGGQAIYCHSHCLIRAFDHLSVFGPHGWESTHSLTPGPSGRWGHSSVYDPARRRTIVFGGQDETATFGDAWTLELSSTGTATWGWLDAAGGALPRTGHAACFDAPRDRMVVVGGSDASGPNTEVWALDLSGTPSWSRLDAQGDPPAATEHTVGVHDPVRQRLLTLAIRDSAGTRRAEVKALDLSSAVWTDVPTSGVIPSTTLTSAVYDTHRDRVLGFGSGGSEPVVALSLGATPTWTALSPGGRVSGQWGDRAVVYDPVLDRMLTFGGGGAFGVYFADVWALQFGSSYLGADSEPVPSRLALALRGPNPAHTAVGLRLDLPAPALARVEVFDLAGRRIAVPLARRLEAGRHEFTWDGRGLAGELVPTGVFLVRATADREIATAKMVRIR